MTLQAIVEEQIRQHLNVSPEEFEYLRHPSPSHLHDPFCYKDMRELVMHLHRFKKEQEKDESLLLMVDGDYDTDGICASVILTAALSVFGFTFRVYIPTMEDGYGLSKKAVDKMKADNEQHGTYKIGMILTADNGIAAFSGISYAKSLGIDVLVTDHHPGGEHLPNAKAVVDANRPGDLYPFKGNSGACVAWKAMLAYAAMFDKDKLPLIERLIVFAGISNVADIMPLRNENRYTVIAAVNIVKEIRAAKTYKEIADTPYDGYNTVFYGLYDLIDILQKEKDKKRRLEEKQPIPLPMNEELFAWYLSPLLNAPRRVHDTCLEGLAVFLTSDMKLRHHIIHRLVELNEEKSKLRDDVLYALPPNAQTTVLCANTKKGISGLIAGKLSERTGLPAVVFSRQDDEMEDVIYTEVPKDGKITGSARSNACYPLDRIMEKMNAKYPNLIFGGGHTTAAGFTIDAKNYTLFHNLFHEMMGEVQNEVLEEGLVVPVPDNRITLSIGDGITAVCERVEDGSQKPVVHELNTKMFADEIKATIALLEGLRPFGEMFEAETSFDVQFTNKVYGHGWDPDFWKTFKFNLFGVEVLTFDIKWADKVMKALENNETVTGVGKLKLNLFRGKITPQIILKGK